MYSVAPDFVVSPLAHVLIIAESCPNSEPVLAALDPFAVVDFSVGPSVDSLSVGLIVQKGTQVFSSCLVQFKSLANSLVVLPLAFVDSALMVYLNTIPVPIPVLFLYLTFEHCSMLVLFDCVAVGLLDLHKVEQL